MKILPLILPLFDALQGIDYKSLYTKQPLNVVFGDKIPFHPNTENLERENQSWIDRKDEHKDRATRVIKLKNHVPLTPHTAFNLLENTRHCWVIFPYDSEVDEIQPIIDILKDLRVVWKLSSRVAPKRTFFYQRCAVASVDLAYPANRRTFGPWVMDFPTLLIRDATKKNGFYKRVFENGHFNLKDAHEWGYVINSEDIENDIDGVMQKILKQSYQPLTFERFFAVYMMWYDDELVKKFHGEVFPGLLTRELGEVKEGMSNGEMSAKIDEWVLKNQELLFSVLDQLKMPKWPQPLPSLKKLFKMFKSPEDYAEDDDGISEEFKEEMKENEEPIEGKEDVQQNVETKDEL